MSFCSKSVRGVTEVNKDYKIVEENGARIPKGIKDLISIRRY
jgi:hypothetical protein